MSARNGQSQKIVRSLAATASFQMLKVLISIKSLVFWKQIELFVLLKSCSFGVFVSMFFWHNVVGGVVNSTNVIYGGAI